MTARRILIIVLAIWPAGLGRAQDDGRLRGRSRCGAASPACSR